jgi:hypothetical protein
MRIRQFTRKMGTYPIPKSELKKYTEEQKKVILKYTPILKTLLIDNKYTPLLYCKIEPIDVLPKDSLNISNTQNDDDYTKSESEPITKSESTSCPELNVIQVILLLHNMNYKFHKTFYINYYNAFHKYLSKSKNEDPIPDDFKKTIQIAFSNIGSLNLYMQNRVMREIFQSKYNKNPALHYCLDVLFEINYNFTLDFIKIFYRSKIDYHNQNIENQTILDNNLIMYSIFSFGNNVKINEEFFNKIITLIQNNVIHTQLLSNYILKILEFINYVHLNNISYALQLITCLLNKIECYDETSIKNICKIIIRHHLKKEWLLKLILHNNVICNVFMDSMCKSKLLHKNLIILFYAMYNPSNKYVPDIQLMNKLLLASDKCKCNHNILGDDCEKYFDNKYFDNKLKLKCKSKSKKIINLIDLFELLNIVPNEETFKIALNNGYVYTVQKMIKTYNFIPDITTLNEAAKSTDINMIREILLYKIEPTEMILETLIGSSKRVNNNLAYYRRRKIKKSCKKADLPEPNILKIVKLFILNGLKINLHCISLLLSLNVHLENLENYDIKYDEDLYFECYVNNWFPDEYINKFEIDKNVLIMRRFTNNKINTVNKVIEFIKSNNIILDNYMIDSILNFNDSKLNDKIFGIGINQCIPSILTMYKNTNEECHINVLKNFIEQNNITKEMMMATVNVIL